MHQRFCRYTNTGRRSCWVAFPVVPLPSLPHSRGCFKLRFRSWHYKFRRAGEQLPGSLHSLPVMQIFVKVRLLPLAPLPQLPQSPAAYVFHGGAGWEAGGFASDAPP